MSLEWLMVNRVISRNEDPYFFFSRSFDRGSIDFINETV